MYAATSFSIENLDIAVSAISTASNCISSHISDTLMTAFLCSEDIVTDWIDLLLVIQLLVKGERNINDLVLNSGLRF